MLLTAYELLDCPTWTAQTCLTYARSNKSGLAHVRGISRCIYALIRVV